MSEQRRWLVNTCVLAVPAEYAGASSDSGDHPQQYFLHCSKLIMTFEEKELFRFLLLGPKIFFTVTHLSEIISPD